MGEWVVPVELATGIPLAIEPRNDIVPVGVNDQGADGHHAVYPGKRDEVRDESGKAVRASRIQWLANEDHDRYHEYCDEYIAEQWAFPKTDNERCGMTVLLCGGYIPATGLIVPKTGPEYVHIDEYKREQMWRSGSIYIDSELDVFTFLRNYLFQQDLKPAATELGIEEFIQTRDMARMHQLGDQLLRKAAELATESIKPVYMEAYRDGLIRPELQPEPKDMIVDAPFLYGNLKRTLAAHKRLRQHLAQAA
jgi:hypothetical protein